MLAPYGGLFTVVVRGDDARAATPSARRWDTALNGNPLRKKKSFDRRGVLGRRRATTVVLAEEPLKRSTGTPLGTDMGIDTCVGVPRRHVHGHVAQTESQGDLVQTCAETCAETCV